MRALSTLMVPTPRQDIHWLMSRECKLISFHDPKTIFDHNSKHFGHSNSALTSRVLAKITQLSRKITVSSKIISVLNLSEKKLGNYYFSFLRASLCTMWTGSECCPGGRRRWLVESWCQTPPSSTSPVLRYWAHCQGEEPCQVWDNNHPIFHEIITMCCQVMW